MGRLAGLNSRDRLFLQPLFNPYGATHLSNTLDHVADVESSLTRMGGVLVKGFAACSL